MSAIGGTFSRTGAPSDRSILASLSRSLRQTGPDGEHFAGSASVSMLYRPFHIERDSRLSVQPVETSDGSLLSWAGRLDNETDLRHALAEDLQEGAGTATLVLAAYRKWGCDAFARLIGDFALALWDAPEQRLILACDSMGRCPLYYHVTPERVAWSSRARALHAALGLPLAFNKEYIAHYFVNRPSVHSPFAGIETVPGGHALVVDRASAKLVRYWSFDPGKQIRYRSDEEYEAHFNELFREAVACRMKAEGPVFAELSGGLDSSSIVCAADRLLAGGETESRELHTVSYVFNRSTTSDERQYIRLVEEQRGQQGIHLSEEEYPILSPLPESFAPDLPTNQICYLARYDHTVRQMNASGARVLLSGIGGDQMFWSEPPLGLPLADLLVEGRIATLLRDCRTLARRRRVPFLKTLWEGAGRPFLSQKWQARTSASRDRVGSWFDAGFAERMALQERRQEVDDLKFPLPSSSQQYAGIRQTMRTFALERCASEGFIDVRYPYLDRRIAEFVLAIPLEQKLRPGEDRSLARRAFKGLLPEPIRTRRTKAGPTEAFDRALVREWPRLSGIFSDPLVSAYGFVDRDAFAVTLRQARHGVVKQLAQLHRTISLELWLRSLVPCEHAGARNNLNPPRHLRQNLQKGEDNEHEQHLRSA